MNPPAFQLYADDFLAGTADMTAEEVGVYIRLLCHAWNKKGLKNDEKRLGILVGICTGNAAACAKEVLASKFELGDDGIWRNARQEKTRAEQSNYSRLQSEKAHLRWDKSKAEQVDRMNAAASAPALPTQCSPSPSPSPTKVRDKACGDGNLPVGTSRGTASTLQPATQSDKDGQALEKPVQKAGEVNRGPLNPLQKELATRFEGTLNGQWINDAGKWILRIRGAAGKCQRVIAEVENAKKEGRIKTTPAQYAEQIWKEFSS